MNSLNLNFRFRVYHFGVRFLGSFHDEGVDRLLRVSLEQRAYVTLGRHVRVSYVLFGIRNVLKQFSVLSDSLVLPSLREGVVGVSSDLRSCLLLGGLGLWLGGCFDSDFFNEGNASKIMFRNVSQYILFSQVASGASRSTNQRGQDAEAS